MPKAEVGSTKYIANKMKAKGLQRLRWYCQICEKQCRDENGFKQHTMSEGHVRAMLQVGEDPKKFINEYSNQFKRDFLQLLKTAHGEKKVHMNNFYQEYIRDKEHIHMNATKWPSLTEFAKFLGREGLCRVEEGDKGLEISFIDDSPDAVRRREDVKRKEMQKQGDEDVEARLLEEQIKRAREAAEERRKLQQSKEPEPTASPREEDAAAAGPIKVSISLGAKTNLTAQPKPTTSSDDPVAIDTFSTSDAPKLEPVSAAPKQDSPEQGPSPDNAANAPVKVSLSLGTKKKGFNPLMGGGRKNPLQSKKDSMIAEPEKKMSNAERIMKEELARKRNMEERGFGGGKRQRLG